MSYVYISDTNFYAFSGSGATFRSAVCTKEAYSAMKITDIHNHTSFSYDGTDTPEQTVLRAIANKIDVLGISDHQFSINERLGEYCAELERCRVKYSAKIKLLCGLEIGTRPKPGNLMLSLVNTQLDYCLFESLDSENGMDLYEFLEWRRLFHIPVGLAHTDIFRLEERYNVDMLDIMRKNNIFLEINLSGNYDYYYDFMTNAKKRERIQKSGIPLSIGSDTHRAADYPRERVIYMNSFLRSMGSRIMFSE